MNRKRLYRGFTLVEILVVISIAALLSSILISSITSAREKSRDNQRIADLKEIQFALEVYRDVNGDYPSYTNGTILGEGGAIDTDLAPFLVNAPVVDPSVGGSYHYFYDSSRSQASCSSAVNLGFTHVVIFAQTMEVDKNKNWATVCGVNGGDGSPTASSYGIILQ